MVTALNQILASRLRALRIERGLSQRDLAKVIGCSRSAVCNYETGANLPNLYQLMSMCLELGVSADYMLGLTDNND